MKVNDKSELLTKGTIPCCIGIDEAGRGPVLGPLVYGAAYCGISEQNQLKSALKLDDSKVLSEKQRETSLKLIQAHEGIGYETISCSPLSLSQQMLGVAKVSLNQISHQCAISLIKRIVDLGVDVREVYVDTVGTPETYQKMLSNLFPHMRIRVEKKADSLFPIVSAASIAAKVNRDYQVHHWEGKGMPIGSELGSGYPADPVTKKWLVDNIDPVYGYPSIVRFSWKTVDDVLAAHDAYSFTFKADDDSQRKKSEWQKIKKAKEIEQKKRVVNPILDTIQVGPVHTF